LPPIEASGDKAAPTSVAAARQDSQDHVRFAPPGTIGARNRTGADVQTTLLGFAIALILALLAALVGPHFINWNDHRAFFEAEASRLVGLKVRIGGDIDASLLPSPSVTLRAIAVGPTGEPSRMAARSLRIEFALGALMRGEMRAVELRLVAPRIAAGLDHDGRIDWPPLALGTETLSIDRFTIEDGHATLTDAGSGAELALDQLWFAGEVRSLTGPIRGKGEFVARGGLYGYELSAGRHGPEGIRLKLGLKTDNEPLALDAEGVLSLERAAPGFDGVVTLARPAGAVLATGQAVAYEPWRLTAKVKAQAAAATLDELSFQYGPEERGVTLAGSGEFVFGARPQLQAKLSARQVDVDRLLATPKLPLRLPFPAMQAFGELLGGALRPSWAMKHWPVKLSLTVDAATLGGGALQGIAGELRSDGAAWTLDKLEFRAPGFTRVEARGTIHPAGRGLGFSGGVGVDSNNPKNLVAWLTGRSAEGAQVRPWQARGDVTLAADRIAVERLQTEIDRGAVEGSVAYTWPAGNRPARLDANLKAEALDLDAAAGFGRSALAGLGLEWPREIALSLAVARARIAGIEARDAAARLTLDARGLAIERLSIADLGEVGIEARGRIAIEPSPSGNVTLDLDARSLAGAISLAEQFAPSLASPLRRLAARHNTATLRTTISLGGSDKANGGVVIAGRVGNLRLNVSASAGGKALALADLSALADTDIRLDARLEGDEAAPLLALLALDRFATTDNRPARLVLSAQGPLSRALRLEAKLDAGAIDAGGQGALRVASDRPAALDLDRFEGAIGGQRVHGRLAFRFGESASVDGAIETETLDLSAVIAAAVGMPVNKGAADKAASWSSEPFAWNAPGLAGRIAFQAERATLAPSLVAKKLAGAVRFGRNEIAVEDIAGELGRGQLRGRMVFENRADGLSARIKVGLTDAEAAELLGGGGRPPIAGRLALQCEFEGVGRSAAALIGSLAGNGTLTLADARLAALNPGVFGAVTRAVELGIPIEGNRIREFVGGVLDSGDLELTRATAAISIGTGQARLKDVMIRSAGTDVELAASADLADASLDALLTVRGPPAGPGTARPAVLVSLKGPPAAVRRTVDTGGLTSWLTLRAVERQSVEIDAIERAARRTPAVTSSTGERPVEQRAPALPPPVEVPAAPRPRVPSRAKNTALPRAIARPPALIGAQN
jgi:large subunit ribosomal protein L24